MPDEQPSSQFLVNDLVARGMTKREIARELGVSPRMVSAVAKGERPGRNYQRTLSELQRRGRAEHRPERRKTASGELARVRGRGGTSRTPEVAPPAPRRGGFEARTTYLHGTQRLHTIQAPKTEGSGREQGRETVMDHLRDAAGGDQRVSFTVTNADGRQMELGRKGGYRAADVFGRASDEGDDPYAWIAGEIEGIYDEETASVPIVSITIRVW